MYTVSRPLLRVVVQSKFISSNVRGQWFFSLYVLQLTEIQVKKYTFLAAESRLKGLHLSI